jgi:hypothetical protein
MLLPVEENPHQSAQNFWLPSSSFAPRTFKLSALDFLFGFRMQGWGCIILVGSGSLHLKWECLRFCIIAVFLVCLGECLGITNSESGITAEPKDDWWMRVTGESACKALSNPTNIIYPLN